VHHARDVEFLESNQAAAVDEPAGFLRHEVITVIAEAFRDTTNGFLAWPFSRGEPGVSPVLNRSLARRLKGDFSARAGTTYRPVGRYPEWRRG